MARATGAGVGGPRRGVLALSLAASAAAALLVWKAAAFAGLGPSVPRAPLLDSVAQARRGDLVLRRARALRTQPVWAKNSPYYSTGDRERLARQRRELRTAKREMSLAKRTVPTLNYDLLPAIEDIYSRSFTGNASIDPIGGRKRYTYFVLFKYAKSKEGDWGPEQFKTAVLRYRDFFVNKMSCRNVEIQLRNSPIPGQTSKVAMSKTDPTKKAPVITLEYPMKEYGDLRRNEKIKPTYEQAFMVEFNFFAPAQAGDYIRKKFYSDNNILRFMVLGHTRTFRQIGEDNELHL